MAACQIGVARASVVKVGGSGRAGEEGSLCCVRYSLGLEIPDLDRVCIGC